MKKFIFFLFLLTISWSHAAELPCRIFSCNSNKALAEAVCSKLGISLAQVQ